MPNQRPGQLVNQIRETMSRADGQVLPPGSETLARDYADAVRSINDALTESIDVLHQGLRSEALYWAELPPALLEQAAQLDFFELPQWVELCQRNGLEAPPKINASAAIELDDAFTQEGRLQEALSRHRRLALMRAPLSARIRILRRIRQMDLDNPLWHQDLLSLEQTRQKQMRTETQRAERQSDTAALQALLEEARTPWETDNPDALLAEIENALQRQRTQQARGKIESCLSMLTEALAASNLQAIRDHLAEYQELTHTSQTPNKAEPEAVTEAKRRIERFKQLEATTKARERAIAALTLAVNNESNDLVTVLAMADQVRADGHTLPEELQNEINTRILFAEQATARRKRSATLAAVAALGIAGGIGGALWWQNAEQTRSDRAYEALNALIDRGEQAEAWKVIQDAQQTKPDWSTQPRFAALQESLSDWVAQDKQRAERFRSLHQKLSERLPSTISDIELETLRREARSLQEQKLLENLQATARQAREQSDEERNEQISQAVQRLSEQHEQLIGSSAVLTWSAQLLSMQQTLTAYTEINNLSATTLAQIQSVKAAIDASIERSRQAGINRAAVDEALDRLAKQAGHPVDYYGQIGAELQNEAVRKTQLAVDLAQVARTARYVADAMAWQKAMDRIPQRDPASTEQATRALAAVNAYQRAYPAGYFAEVAAEYADYLRQAQIALNPDNAPTAEGGDIALLLRAPLVADLHAIYLTDGGAWYTTSPDPGQPTLPGRRVYRVLNDLNDAKRNNLTDRTLRDKDVIEPFAPRPAGIRRFANQAWQKLREVNQPWQSVHLNLLTELLKTEEIDPIQQVSIAKELIDLSTERDWPSSNDLKRWRSQLNTVDTALDWTNPADEKANDGRSIATQVLETAPNIESLVTRTKTRHESLFARLVGFEPIGLLDQSESAATTGVSSRPNPVQIVLQLPKKDGNVWAVLPSQDAPAGWQPIPVAKIENGRLIWQQSATDLPTGTLMFWQPEAAPPHSGNTNE